MTALTASLVFPAVVTAEPPESAPARTKVIMIRAAEHDAGLARDVESSTRAQLAGLAVEFSTTVIPDFGPKLSTQIRKASGLTVDADVLAVFWFELTDDGELYVYLRGAGEGATLVRNVGRSKAERNESLAIIVRSSVSALQRGAELSFDEISDAPPPEKKVVEKKKDPVVIPPVVKPAPRAWLRLEVGHQMTGETDDIGHGVSLALAVPLHKNISLWLGYSAMQASETSHDGVTLTLQRHPVVAGIRGVLPFSFGELAVGIGGTADLVHHQTLGPLATLVVDDGYTPQFSAVMAADLRLSLSPRIDLFFSPGAELFPQPISYAIATPRDTLSVADQPHTGLWVTSGLAIDLF